MTDVTQTVLGFVAIVLIAGGAVIALTVRARNRLNRARNVIPHLDVLLTGTYVDSLRGTSAVFLGIDATTLVIGNLAGDTEKQIPLRDIKEVSTVQLDSFTSWETILTIDTRTDSSIDITLDDWRWDSRHKLFARSENARQLIIEMRDRLPHLTA
ncbi:MAG: hypothetical protein KF761_11070 [Salinibacterium sp.]|nr:hypothetical protein [Salinibacterium sp.]